jgi:glutamate-ammonia-ligase adenylyltransferase
VSSKSEQSSQHLATKLLAELRNHAPEEFIDPLTHACTRFAEACEDLTVGYDLLSHLYEQANLAKQLSKCWLASEFSLDHHCRDAKAFLALIDSGDLQRSYHSLPDHLLADHLLRDRLSPHSDEFSSVYTDQLRNKIIAEVGDKVEEDLLPLLRCYRQREMQRIIWRDLNRLSNMEETTLDLSLLAGGCINEALNVIHAHMVKQYGQPIGRDSQLPQQLIVMGMGKLGAYELNLSSDIDLIFAFPESGETNNTSQSISNQEFFTRLGKMLIRVIDSRTVDGFVFRVDMRLRPNGQSGPLALSFDAMEDYYQQHGREWERYAMVKARVVAGDIASGQQLMTSLKPFVYRRYLDFGAIDALRDMKKLIEQQVKRQNLSKNIKLGAGGIREIEFIVQSFQLIHGGRLTDFQQPNLLKMLPLLNKTDCLSVVEVKKLSAAYHFLRDTEHALQGWRDEQTQNLPDDSLALQRLAFALNCDSIESFGQTLQQHRDNVSEVFASIVTNDEDTLAEDDEKAESLIFWRWFWLSDNLDVIDPMADGISAHTDGDDQYKNELIALDPEQIKLLANFRSSRKLLSMENQGRDRLDKLMPLLLYLCNQVDEPFIALQRVMPFVESVLRRTAYLALLIETPKALKQLVSLCYASKWISDQLARYPSLLDELLDHRNLYVVPSGAELADQLRQQLLRVQNDDLETAMDVLRHFKLAHGLRVAACQISGALPLMKISDYLTFLAEVILQAVLEIAWQAMVEKHGMPNTEKGLEGGVIEGSRHFIIVGYGKLGGIELGPASDLDLVFIHDVDSQAETLAGENQKAITHSVFFTRLGQKIIHVLTAQTISGALYEVDMRLRPSGASGLLVSGFDAFKRYQQESAWTWEHQALVRARAVAGDPALIKRFTELRKELICQSRDREKLLNDIVEMREKMRAHLDKPKQSESLANNVMTQTFNVKQSRGGIVDIEFLVQFIVLANADNFSCLADWTDNIRLLEILPVTHIITPIEAENLIAAYQDYRAAAHLAALKQEGSELSLQLFSEHRESVEQVWINVFNPRPSC